MVVVVRVRMHPMVQARGSRQSHHRQQMGKQQNRRQTVAKTEMAVGAAHGVSDRMS